MDEENLEEKRPTSEQLEKEIGRIWLRNETLKAVWGAIRTLLVFAAVAVLVSMKLFPVVRVEQGSMYPTLEDGQIIILATFGKIGKGDIIAFHYNNQVLIKRVIAVGGDSIDLTGDGIVILNGMQLSEMYVPDPAVGDCTIGLPMQVPANHYFVMGDHRLTSLDSRRSEIGPVSADQVVGKVLFRVWPITKLGIPR